jgi:hypothetical protein
MLPVKLDQEVWLCTHGVEPREAVVEEISLEDYYFLVSFWTTDGEPAMGAFSLGDGYNVGNRAYWIQLSV